ncbi:serine hydroxymethyltransferase [Bacillus cereus]|nr:serine hydroxymethyltransferase [Bacillus cereus]
MIIRTKPDEIILIRQHDHGFLAGEFARNFRKDVFEDKTYLKECINAIYEHDRGWIGLDKTPFWNDAKNTPYTFMDCPSSLRFVFYTLGLNEIENTNPYGAILCSKHFISFPLNQDNQEMIEFYKQELDRQKKFLKTLTKMQHAMFDKHYKLLKFCDELSLYACMNEPGVTKNEEIDLFKEGFKETEIFNKNSKELLKAEWLDKETIRIMPFPFEVEFKAYVRYKSIQKNTIKEMGIVKADAEAEFQRLELHFVR